MAYPPMPIYSYGLYSNGLGSEAAFGARSSLPTPVHLPVHMPVHMYVQVSIHMSIYVYMGINVRTCPCICLSARQWQVSQASADDQKMTITIIITAVGSFLKLQLMRAEARQTSVIWHHFVKDYKPDKFWFHHLTAALVLVPQLFRP